MPTPNAEQWKRVEALFTVLARLPTRERAAALSREVPDDVELRQTLERMLGHADGAASALSRAVEAGEAALGTAASWAGRRFGPYEVVREVGRGGMGLVFEAIRADDEYRKRVAVKIAPAWRGDPMLAERFLAERQILAELEHDNIARFLDGGTEQGIPYFAMEFVDGEPITDYCQRVAAPLAVRLALFQQVCAGVAFAHGHLVAHRDLKPSNILVTTQGVPKLVDFGIAKVLTPPGGAGATQTIAAAWTPDYVSPEQVRGLAITPRTDVYSLGLVLYELLCDTRAQQADTSSLLALDRSVCDATPVRPSERLLAKGDRATARRVAGDLDTIVMTAISKNSADRYASASALSDDIRRHLGSLPILARPTGRVRRARKFVVRHRTVVAAAAVVLAVGLAGLSSTLLQARRAQRRFQQVRALANAFVFEVHDRIAELPGTTEARAAIVTTALSYLESLRSDVGGDSGLARELASAYDKVGSAQGLQTVTNLGDTAGALRSYQQAEALLQPLVSSGDDEARHALTAVLLHLSIVQRARGDAPAALAQLGRARAIALDLLARRPQDAAALDLAGEVAAARSRLAFELRDLEAAEQSSLEATDSSRRLLALDPGNRRYQDGVATSHTAAGAMQLGRGKIQEAANHFREAVAIREGLTASDPLNVEYRRNLTVSYGNLADVLGVRAGDNLGDVDGAVAALRKAARLGEQARTDDVKDRRALYDLANVYVRLGTALTEAVPPRIDEALQELRRADANTRELLAQDPDVATYRFLEMIVARRLGDALGIAGRRGDALAALERTRRIGSTLLGGPNGPAVRTAITQATARRALLEAESGSLAAAVRDADLASAELTKGPLGSPLVDAPVREQLGRAYLVAAGTKGNTTVAARAREHLAASADLWKSARISAALEPRRAAVLARLAEALDGLSAR